MVSKVQIYNRALNLLGLEEVSLDTEVNKRTKALGAAWDMVVPELMHLEPWLFTVKEERIAQLDEDGIIGYENAYRMPADCIAVIEPVDTDVVGGRGLSASAKIRIHGNTIYSNSDELTIQYVKNEEDISKWTTGFTKCLAYLLAIECCYKLIENDKREKSLIEIYELRVKPQSIQTDAMQQKLEQVDNTMQRIGYEE